MTLFLASGRARGGARQTPTAGEKYNLFTSTNTLKMSPAPPTGSAQGGGGEILGLALQGGRGGVVRSVTALRGPPHPQGLPHPKLVALGMLRPTAVPRRAQPLAPAQQRRGARAGAVRRRGPPLHPRELPAPRQPPPGKQPPPWAPGQVLEQGNAGRSRKGAGALGGALCRPGTPAHGEGDPLYPPHHSPPSAAEPQGGPAALGGQGEARGRRLRPGQSRQRGGRGLRSPRGRVQRGWGHLRILRP